MARFDGAIAAGLDAARRAGLYVILRFQDRRERRLAVADGVMERVSSGTSVGVGVHAFTAEGWAGFASWDDCSPRAVRAAVERAGVLARAAGERGAVTNRAVYDLVGAGRRVVRSEHRRLVDTPLDRQTAALSEAHEAARALAGSPTVRTTQALVDDEWRIARSDGTDVSFAVPRARARHALSLRQPSGLASATASISGVDGVALSSPEALAAFDRRSRHALRGALDALDAPPIPTGSYRIVIDHALAKGLAHEAIGHLCESDVDTSVFFRDGKLRLGERVGMARVSVVDGPIPGDYAHQPVSANGLERRDQVLVERGILVGGLADLFSAGTAGLPIAGACRAGSFRARPVPRMTNVRIVVEDALPLDAPSDAVTPEAAATALRKIGLLDAGGPPALYLAGYRGGQAHPRRGDFVFSAAVAYDLANGCAPRRGATLSGLAAHVLDAVLAGVGPLQLDAAGTCLKDGWPAPSSGGSHALLVLEASPHLTVGGAA